MEKQRASFNVEFPLPDAELMRNMSLISTKKLLRCILKGKFGVQFKLVANGLLAE